MAFQSLYRRYRPRRFGELKGQDHVVRALRNAVREGNVAHAYLFSGPRGTGKTSTARILAKALNCEAPVDGEPDGTCGPCLAIEAGTSLDVLELDAASNRRIDDIRELLRGVALATGGRTKLYILDEVHQLTTEASSALLKTLEEPPAHVVFVLATTDPHKVLPTIRSRTQHYDFRLLSAGTLAEHLRWVADDAGLEVSDDVVDLAVRRAQGSARDALSALDQLVASGGILDDDASLDELAEALCERDTGRALLAVATAVTAGREPRRLGEALLAHLRDALLSVLAPGSVSLPDSVLERVSDQGRRLGPPATVRALDTVGEALLAMREAPDPRVVLEVALVRATRPELDASPAALLERVERLERAGRSAATPSTPARHAAGEPAQSPRPGPAPPRPAPPLPGRSGPAPPPPSPPRAATSSDTAPGDLPSREELTVAWADHVLGALRPRAKGLYAGGRFVEVDGTAVFALPSEALQRKADVMRAEVEAALAAHFARTVPLRLIVDSPDDPPPPGASGAGPVDDEIGVDVADLRDAPDAGRSGLDRLTQAFPGAEIIEE